MIVITVTKSTAATTRTTKMATVTMMVMMITMMMMMRERRRRWRRRMKKRTRTMTRRTRMMRGWRTRRSVFLHCIYCPKFTLLMIPIHRLSRKQNNTRNTNYITDVHTDTVQIDSSYINSALKSY